MTVEKIIALDGSQPIQLSVSDGISQYVITAAELSVEKVGGWEPAAKVPWTRDISGELARNENCPGALSDGWWKRRLEQIDGLTFHHTLSDSPHATAAHYLHKGGGRPSIPYTIWISQTGEVLLCLALTEGCWHDHTGHKNTHLAVGLAGKLHLYRPADVQLQAAARVAAWAIESREMGITLETVRGHRDLIATICPGWASKASGFWKDDLYERIEGLL